MEDEIEFNHAYIFPQDPMLCCIVGSTGSGKTMLTFRMLTTPGLLDFENLYIYTTTPKQPYYKFLKGLEVLGKRPIQELFLEYKDKKSNLRTQLISEIIKNVAGENVTGMKVIISENKSDFGFSQLDSGKKNLIVFDDCVDEKCQDMQRSYFTKGRHYNCHCIYQSQTFFDVDKVIRKNTNCYILFKLNPKDLTSVMQSVDHGKDTKRFREICRESWNEKYKYVFINTLEPKDNISIGITDHNWGS